jgi:hypothetical protein
VKPQFDPTQRREAVELLEDVTWGDMDLHIRSLEGALERALEATAREFFIWEQDGEDRYGDEFSVTPADLEAMTPEWRLAHAGRLVRSLAHCYGVDTGDFGPGPPLLQADELPGRAPARAERPRSHAPA